MKKISVLNYLREKVIDDNFWENSKFPEVYWNQLPKDVV